MWLCLVLVKSEVNKARVLDIIYDSSRSWVFGEGEESLRWCRETGEILVLRRSCLSVRRSQLEPEG
jgi:hypothetical protein